MMRSNRAPGKVRASSVSRVPQRRHIACLSGTAVAAAPGEVNVSVLGMRWMPVGKRVLA